jgi:toxin HigB-1
MEVQFSRLAEKQLKKAPAFIQKKAFFWVVRVEQDGIQETRKHPGFHDEPLSGQRQGQRSIRLNQQWRLIYCEITGQVLEVMEITPHDYRTR